MKRSAFLLLLPLVSSMSFSSKWMSQDIEEQSSDVLTTDTTAMQGTEYMTPIYDTLGVKAYDSLAVDSLNLLSRDSLAMDSSYRDSLSKDSVAIPVKDGLATPAAVTRDCKYKPRWFVTGGLGVQAYRGENEWKMGMMESVGFSFNVGGGRWVYPGIGIGLNFDYARFRGLWMASNAETRQAIKQYQAQNPNVTDQAALEHCTSGVNFQTFDKYTGSSVRPDDELYRQRGGYMNLYVSAMFNIPELVNGPNPYRHDSFIPFIGLGMCQGFGSAGHRASALSLDLGFTYAYNFNENWAVTGTVKGAIVGDRFDGEMSNGKDFDGLFNVNVGCAYTFGYQTCDGSCRKAKAEKKPNAKSNDLVLPKGAVISAGHNVIISSKASGNSNDNLEARVDSLIQVLSGEKGETVKVMQTVKTAFPYYVHFDINDAIVENREKVNLKTIAKLIKSAPDMKFSVKGYADKQTGSDAVNRNLSVKRANNVFDVLVNEMGVPSSQLHTMEYGGVDNMFYNDNTLSRCVIITIEE